MLVMLWSFFSPSLSRYQKFAEYERASFNATRLKIVNATLAEAAGVYLNKSYDRSLQKTVIITVAAFNQATNGYYKVYFKNFLCFIKHYQLDLIVYILHHEIANLEVEMQTLSHMGVRVLTYPDNLFWNLLATKKSHINRGLNICSDIMLYSIIM